MFLAISLAIFEQQRCTMLHFNPRNQQICPSKDKFALELILFEVWDQMSVLFFCTYFNNNPYMSSVVKFVPPDLCSPTRLFQPRCLLNFPKFSLQHVYSNHHVYQFYLNFPTYTFIPSNSFIQESRVITYLYVLMGYKQ